MTPLRLARLSLSRHKFTTAITGIAIGLSVACSGMLLRTYELSESRFSAIGRGGDAVVGAKAGGIEILLGSLNGEGDFPDFLPYKLYESLKSQQTVHFEDGAMTKPSYIEQITPFVYFGKYSGYRVVGTDGTFFQRKREAQSLTLQEGTAFSQKGEVVVGSLIAKRNNLKVGDFIHVRSWFGDKEPSSLGFELKIVGVLNPTGSQWDRTLFSSIEQAHQVFAQNFSAISEKTIWGPQVLHYFLIYLNPDGFAPLEALVNRRTVGQVIDVEKEKSRLYEISGAGQRIGIFVTSFMIILGGLSVCSMLISRYEGMALQLAVLRALGYTKRELSQWLLWEGLLLALWGVFVGAIIDLIGFPILRSLLGASLPSMELVASSIFQSSPIWLMAIMATVFAVFVPMARLSRQDPHNSLKGL